MSKVVARIPSAAGAARLDRRTSGDILTNSSSILQTRYAPGVTVAGELEDERDIVAADAVGSNVPINFPMLPAEVDATGVQPSPIDRVPPTQLDASTATRASIDDGLAMATATITQLDPVTTNAASVRFEVAFGTSITPTIDASWFDIVTIGTIRNAAITSVTPVAGSDRTKFIVTVATGTGDGRLHINLSRGYDFGAPVTYELPLLQRPQSAVLRDLDGDSRPDVIFANESNDCVSVLRGIGGGAYSQTVIPVGDRPTSIEVGDVDHDGRADIVVANAGSHSISVLRGDTSVGGFSAASTFDLFIGQDWTYPNFVTLADANGDGHVDVLAATTTPDLSDPSEVVLGLTVLYGNGAGSFQQGPTYAEAAGFRPFSRLIAMETADLDRDGRTDVIVISGGSQIWALMGQADGSFSTEGRSYTPTPSNPTTLLVQDFNRSTGPDLVVSTQFGLQIKIGRGDGTFADQWNSISSTTASSLAAADVNRDGKMDLLAGRSSGGGVLLYLGNGDGTFTADPRIFQTSSSPSSIVTGDLDLDFGLDIVTTDLTTGSISVLFNEVRTTGGQPYTLDRTPPSLTIGTAGGLTNQTTQTVSGTADATTATTISIYEGAVLRGTATVGAGGAWSTTVSLSGQGYHQFVAKAADALGNQGTSNGVLFRLDTLAPTVAIASAGGPTNKTAHIVTGTLGTEDAGRTVTLLEGTTVLGTAVAAVDGSWSTSVALSGEGAHDIVARVTDAAGNAATSSAVTYRLDTTQPRLLSISRLDPASLDEPFVDYRIDFTEPVDGLDMSRLGLVTSGAQSAAHIVSVTEQLGGARYAVRIATAPGDGSIALQVDGLSIEDAAGNVLPGGSFGAAQEAATIYREPRFMAGGDLDGDGDIDLVVNQTSRTTVLLNQNGTFVPQAPTPSTVSGSSNLALADVNEDGRLDIITQGTLGLAIAVGTGDGSFSNSPGVAIIQPSASSFAVGDVNGDGHVDVVYSRSTETVALLGRGDGTFVAGTSVLGEYRVQTVADVNGDGMDDWISVKIGTNNFAVSLSNGNGSFQAPVTYATGASDLFITAVAVGDLNRDGKADLVFGHDSGVSVRLGTGDGAFGAAQPYVVGTGQLVRDRVQLADLNGDGALDVIAAWATNIPNFIGNAAVLMGRGDGTLGPATILGATPYWKGVTIADATGDGIPDILVAETNRVVLLTNQPATTVGPAYTIDRSLNASPLATDDAYGAAAGRLLRIAPAAGLLANDQDVDSVSLSAALLGQPQHGALTLLASGGFDYRPDAGYVGFDSFTYRTSDGTALSEGATVTVALASDAADALQGTSRADRVFGFGGNDTLFGAAGNDWLSGDDGNDLLRGDSGDDTLSGGIGADSLDGGGGNDDLLGGDGDDLLEGGAGNDALIGNAGLDTVRYALAGAGVTVSLAAAGAQNTGGAGIDTLQGIENAVGSAFNDVLVGSDLDNTLQGLAGNDTLKGGDGDDLLDGGAGNDTLIGNAGLDTVRYASAGAGVTVSLALTDAQNTGGAGSDTLQGIENAIGSAFDDVLVGSDLANRLQGLVGNDELRGGNGNDRLEGGDGNDELNGGAGADVMVGGAGDDTYVVDNALDVVMETGGGRDTISTSVSLTLDAGQSIEVLSGRGAADLTLRGNELRNIISGGAGNDRLIGGLGNDTLEGNAGDDTLLGGVGNDILEGGAGADRFNYTRGDGNDRFTDFNGASGDWIALRDVTVFRIVNNMAMLSDGSTLTAQTGYAWEVSDFVPV